MNAVEIEEAVSALAGAPFDPAAFPYAFLTAFGVKDTTIARLRKGDTNASDVGGVLQRGNIHIGLAVPGGVGSTLRALRESSKTASAKAKFILATDGDTLEAEDLVSGEPLACPYGEFADHFGFFLPLAGISTVKELKNNPIDVKATGRLNRLYVELLKENEQWGTPERRHDLNQFMARLIFCFFAEDTGIFIGTNLFTSTIEQMSTTEAGSVEFVLTELFRAMDVRPEDRTDAKLRPWADKFPWVNGGLFAGGKPCPKFSRVARSYLLRAGELNWKEINPDIFGSMIQAVADDSERGSLGMHYTSVPNIMKVLGPLFLDDLRAQLEAAGDNARKLRNLRKRLANIRVFDPACGSGNFLVIAYIRMREIEHEIVKLTDDEPKSVIPLANFYGIEIKDFAAEIARLALLIAEFQCDVRFISQQMARTLVLPLKKTGQIKTGNALREDWLEICAPLKPVRNNRHFGGATDIDDASTGVDHETYICGNPPYLGAKKKTALQVADMDVVGLGQAKLLDYVCAFIWKGLPLIKDFKYKMALVSTSSICQGEQVSLLWPRVFESACIRFAYTPFKWANSAARNAGVFCTIIGLEAENSGQRILISGSSQKKCAQISPYLVEGEITICPPRREPLSRLMSMTMGSNPVDGKKLILQNIDLLRILEKYPSARPFFRKYGGTEELASGDYRWCLWLQNNQVAPASQIPPIKQMIDECKNYRMGAGRDARKAAKRPHAFCYSTFSDERAIHVGNTIGNAFQYVPATIREAGFVSSHAAFTVYDVSGPEFAIIVSTMHRVWAEAVAGRLGNGTRYGNTIVYNTFPLPALTDNNAKELITCGREIILAREEHYPATIADLYDPEKMPDDLRQAHEKNDETLERIYIGRRFRNDTERLEKLFELYTKMTAAENKPAGGKKPAGRGRGRAAAGVA